MTTLLQRCRTVTAKFEHLKLAQRNVNQQLLVQERTREWKKSQDKLKGVSACAACLPLDARSQKIVDEKRAHLQHNAAEVLERLKSNDDIAELNIPTGIPLVYELDDAFAPTGPGQYLDPEAAAAGAAAVAAQGAKK